MKRILIAGTHLTPALATALELKKRNFQLLYIGRPNHIDQRSCEQYKIPFKPLVAPKLHRRLTFDHIRQLTFAPVAIFDAYKIIHSFKPDLILSFGGYLAVPVGLIAKIKKISLIIHEQTATLGLANRLLSPLADKVTLSYPPQLLSPKQILVGNPIRPGILKPNLNKISPNLKKFIDSSDKPIIYITGGHQGARFINQLVQQSLSELIKNYFIVWQHGQEQVKTKSKKVFFTSWFNEHEVGYILKYTLFSIARAGANTITDLQATKIPAILIPLPTSANQEQQINAEYLQDHQAALVLKQSNLSSEIFLSALDQFVSSFPLYQQGIEKLYKDQIKDAAIKLSDLVEEHA